MKKLIKRILLENRQDKYMGKVVDSLISDTNVSPSEGSEGKDLYFPWKPDEVFHSSWKAMMFYPLDFSNRYHLMFYEYIKNTYGTSEADVITLWDTYRRRINDVFVGTNINESTDRQEKLLSYIYDNVVKNLKVGQEKGFVSVMFPFELDYICRGLWTRGDLESSLTIQEFRPLREYLKPFGLDSEETKRMSLKVIDFIKDRVEYTKGDVYFFDK